MNKLANPASGTSAGLVDQQFRPRRLIALFAAVLLIVGSAPASAQPGSESVEAYFEDASSRMSREDYAGAMIQLRNALQIDSSHAPSMLALGRALLETGEPGEAALVLNDALLLGVNPINAVPLLIDAYIASGSHEELLRTLRADRTPGALRAEVYAGRAQAYLASGRTNEAGAMLSAAAKLDSQNYRRRLAEVTYHLQRGDLDAAADTSRALIQHSPYDTRSWSAHGSVLHARGNWADAASAYETALREEKDNSDTRVALIDLLLVTRQNERAAGHIDYMRENRPTEPRAAYYSALLAARMGDREKEREELATASALFAALKQERLRTNPQLLMLAALSNHASGSHELAAAYIESYLAVRPGDVGAMRLKASNSLALNDVSDAIRTLLPLHQRAPQDSATTSLLAAAYSQEGDHKRAAALLASMGGASGGAPLEEQLAFTQLNSGDYAAGIESLERLRERNPGQPALELQLAVAYLRGRRPDEALALLDALPAEALAPPLSGNLRALALLQRGDTEQAESIWRRILETQPDSLPALLNMARLKLQDNQLEEATGWLQRTLNAYPDSSRALIVAARLDLRLGKLDDALRNAERAHDLDPHSDDAAWQYIRALLASNAGQEARAVSAKFAATHPKSFPAAAIHGRTLQLLQAPDEAQLVYKQMARRAEASAEDLYRIALLQRSAGDAASAELSLGFALERNTGFRAARLELAAVQRELEKYAEAERSALQQASRTPEDAIAWLNVGEARLAQGQFTTAADSFRQAREAGEGVWSAVGIYRALDAAGQPKAAEAALRDALAPASNDPRLLAALSDLLLAQERWREADEILSQLLDGIPNSAAHLNNRAVARQQLGELGAAEADARAALDLNGSYGAAYDTLGWVLVESGRPEEALPLLREAAARLGNDHAVRFHLARALWDLERREEAAQELQQSLAGNVAFPGRETAEELLAQLQHQ